MYLSIPLSLVRTPAFWWRLTLPLSYKLIFLTCSSIWLPPSTSRAHDFWIIAQLTCGIAGYDYQSVRRWTTFKRLGYGLIECEKVNCYFVLFLLLDLSPFHAYYPHPTYRQNLCYRSLFQCIEMYIGVW